MKVILKSTEVQVKSHLEGHESLIKYAGLAVGLARKKGLFKDAKLDTHCLIQCKKFSILLQPFSARAPSQGRVLPVQFGFLQVLKFGTRPILYFQKQTYQFFNLILGR